MTTDSLDPIDPHLEDVTHRIRHYLDDERVLEIRVNPDGKVWVVRAGEGKSLTDTIMPSRDAVALLRYVAAKSEKTLTDQNPSLSGTLPHWHARVQGVIAPLVAGTAVTIRKRPTIIYSLDDYVTKRIITQAQRDALEQAVLERKNILVGGGTFTGKTTFANALLRVMAERTEHRLYIAEDTPELQCAAPDVVALVTDPPKYDCHRAVMDAMRHSPDRIIVGELRDGTALELVKAWNTGHLGGIATLHANHTRGMLHRISQLVEEVIFPAPRDYIAEAVNVCVHLTLDARSPAGRRLSGLDAVRGYDPDRGGWLLEPLVSDSEASLA